MTTRRWLLQGVAFLLLGALVFAIALIGISRTLWERDLLDVLRQARAGPLLLGMGVISLATPCTAMRWRALLPHPHRIHPVRLTGIQCVGLVFNYALPGPVGELATAAMVQRRTAIPTEEALLAAIVARLIGLGSAALVAGVLTLIGAAALPEAYRSGFQALAVLLALGGIALAIAAVRPKTLQAHLQRGSRPLKVLPGFLGRAGHAFERLGLRATEALARTAQRGTAAYLQSLGWALGGHAAVATGLWLAALSLGLNPPPLGVIFAYAAALAGAVVLFLFPGSQLGWDAMFMVFFAGSTGVDPTEAAAMALIARAQQSAMVLIGLAGLVALGGDLLPAAEDS